MTTRRNRSRLKITIQTRIKRRNVETRVENRWDTRRIDNLALFVLILVSAQEKSVRSDPLWLSVAPNILLRQSILIAGDVRKLILDPCCLPSHDSLSFRPRDLKRADIYLRNFWAYLGIDCTIMCILYLWTFKVGPSQKFLSGLRCLIIWVNSKFSRIHNI